MNCEQIESKLVPYLLKDLPEPEQEAVQQHLDACESCRASVRELEQTLELLGGALAAPFEAPDALDETRRAGIYGTARVEPVKKKKPILKPLMELAAVLVILLISAAILIPAFNSGLDKSKSLTIASRKAQEDIRLAEERWNQAPPAEADPHTNLEEIEQELERLAAKPAEPAVFADMAESPFDAEPVSVAEDALEEMDNLAVAGKVEEGRPVELNNLFAGRSKSNRKSVLRSYGGGAQALPDEELLARDGHNADDDLGSIKFGRELASAKSPVEGRYKEVLGFGEADEEFRDGLAKADAPDVTMTTADKYYYNGRPAPAPVEESRSTSRAVTGPVPALSAKPEATAPARTADHVEPAFELAKNNESLAFEEKGREAQWGFKASEKKKVAPESSISPARDEGQVSASALRPGARSKAERVSGEREGARKRLLSFDRMEEAEANREILHRQQVAAAREAGAERVVTETEDLKAQLKQEGREDKNGKQLAEVNVSGAARAPILGDVVVTGQLLERGNRAIDQDADGDEREEISKPVFQAYSFNSYVETKENAFSTFAIDVDTAAYTMARGYMMNGSLPPPDAVRTEEFLNFFNYNYPAPKFGTFAVYSEAAPTPFGSGYLLKVGVKGKRIGREEQRNANLTFVIDTSGSMDTKDRLGLARKSLKMLVDELSPQDQVAIVQYSSQSQLLLEHTPAAQKEKILEAIDALQVSGSTHLEQGLTLGYQVAARAFDPKAVNQVLLVSDGAANLGAASAEEILGQVEGYRNQGIFCSNFGFGMGTYNDVMLETLANKGNGTYQFIDSEEEARRVFVDDLSATLNKIAADVKIQVEFNPARVAQYRQLGYENRQLTKQQFRDDTVDAGEVGSGQSVTALYEIHLKGDPNLPIGTVRVRYRDLDTGKVEEIARPISAGEVKRAFDQADTRFRLAAAVSAFAEKLRGSPYVDHLEYRDIAGVLRPVAMELELDPYVQELSHLVRAASSLPRTAE